MNTTFTRNISKGYLIMSNDEAQTFVEYLRLGTNELYFWYRKQKYLMQWMATVEDPTTSLLIERLTGPGDWLFWEEKQEGSTRDETVEKFLRAKIWDNRTFWDACPEMEWVDE